MGLPRAHRFLGGRSFVDHVATSFEVVGQGVSCRRLVFDDQQCGAGHVMALSVVTSSGTTGPKAHVHSKTAELAPASLDRPAHGLRQAGYDRHPNAHAAALVLSGRAGLVELLEKMGQSGIGDAGSIVLHADFNKLVRPVVAADYYPTAAVTDGVFQEVGQDLAQVDLIGQYGRGRILYFNDDLFGGGGPCPSDHLRHQVAEVARLELRHQGATLDPAEVEKVAHQPAHPLRLGVDGLEGLALVLMRPDDRLVEHAAGRSAYRRQRRAQIVRDRVEQCRLEGFASASDFGVGPLQSYPVADDCLTELVGRGRKNSGLGSVRFALVSGAEGPHGTESLARCLDPNAMNRDPVGLAARRSRGHVHANPTRRLIARRPLEHNLPGGDRECLTGSGVGDRRLLGGRRSEAEPDSIHGRGCSQAVEHDRRRFLHGSGFGQGTADTEEGLSLAGPLSRLLRMFGLNGYEPADGKGHGQEQQQVEPLFRAADCERV